MRTILGEVGDYLEPKFKALRLYIDDSLASFVLNPGKIDGVIDITKLPRASTTTIGIVQLVDTATSDSVLMAPTARLATELADRISTLESTTIASTFTPDDRVVLEDALRVSARLSEFNTEQMKWEARENLNINTIDGGMF